MSMVSGYNNKRISKYEMNYPCRSKIQTVRFVLLQAASVLTRFLSIQHVIIDLIGMEAANLANYGGVWLLMKNL